MRCPPTEKTSGSLPPFLVIHSLFDVDTMSGSPSDHQSQQQPPRPPLQSTVSRSSSFSRAASFRFTSPSPRPSPHSESALSPSSNPASPVLGPTTTSSGGAVINHNVPPPGQGHLSRHGSLSSRSRPGSIGPSPISSPRDEHKGTW